MRFLCERCKTRYSIGDDRVRGKILKIRCKNCSNVITVREGMPEPVAEPAATRRTKTTTAAPVIGSATPAKLPSRVAPGQGAAPAALHEEWYVSIDGVQAGPFALAEAQRWVAQKAYDDDLHCWCEGFDDWLPVDKVSHFRGLRRRPASASAPPPLPRARTDEPKPLFAATMARLEQGSPALPLGLPPVAPVAAAGEPVAPELARGTPLPPEQLDHDQATRVDPPPFGDDAATHEAARRLRTDQAPIVDAGAGGDAELELAEVSRVVKLTQLDQLDRLDRDRRDRRAKARGAVPPPRSTTVILDALPSAPPEVVSQPALAHRRQMIALMVCSFVLLGAAVAAFVLAPAEERASAGALGRTDAIDTTRPDIVRRGAIGAPTPGTPDEPPPSAGSADPRTPPRVRPPTGPGPGAGAGSASPPPADAGALRADEIQDMAGKHAGSTQRCYMRAQRGADAIVVGEVRKIAVTLTIAPDGRVTDVRLSKHADDALGRCLDSSIRGWRFRASAAGGTFQFSLVFS